MIDKTALQRRIRFLLIFFIFALSVAGLTAIPLRWELLILNQWFGTNSFLFQILPSMATWISRVNNSVLMGYGIIRFLHTGQIG